MPPQRRPPSGRRTRLLRGRISHGDIITTVNLSRRSSSNGHRRRRHIRQRRHTRPKPRHLPPDNLLLPLQRAGPALQTLMPHLALPQLLEAVRRLAVVREVRQRVGERLHGRHKLLGRAPALERLLAAGLADLGDEGGVLHRAFVFLVREEGVVDLGFGAVGFVRGEGVDVAADSGHALLAGGEGCWGGGSLGGLA